jgi:hypothetical protein
MQSWFVDVFADRLAGWLTDNLIDWVVLVAT